MVFRSTDSSLKEVRIQVILDTVNDIKPCSEANVYRELEKKYYAAIVVKGLAILFVCWGTFMSLQLHFAIIDSLSDLFHNDVHSQTTKKKNDEIDSANKKTFLKCLPQP